MPAGTVFLPQVHTIFTPVGTDVPGISKGWNNGIGGVSIDNPSLSWLSIDIIPGGIFVPPLTLGWAIGITPPKTSLDVRFVDGPFGSTSLFNFGAPVSITIYESNPDGSASVVSSGGQSIGNASRWGGQGSDFTTPATPGTLVFGTVAPEFTDSSGTYLIKGITANFRNINQIPIGCVVHIEVTPFLAGARLAAMSIAFPDKPSDWLPWNDNWTNYGFVGANNGTAVVINYSSNFASIPFSVGIVNQSVQNQVGE